MTLTLTQTLTLPAQLTAADLGDIVEAARALAAEAGPVTLDGSGVERATAVGLQSVAALVRAGVVAAVSAPSANLVRAIALLGLSPLIPTVAPLEVE